MEEINKLVYNMIVLFTFSKYERRNKYVFKKYIKFYERKARSKS